MRFILVFFFSFAFFLFASKAYSHNEIVIDKVYSVYDGDTITVIVNDWPPLFRKMSIRINGIDTPEMRGKCDEEKALAVISKQLNIDALDGAKIITLENARKGKYFRLLADVYIDGKSLAQMQINAGLARPYDGGARKSWCKNP